MHSTLMKLIKGTIPLGCPTDLIFVTRYKERCRFRHICSLSREAISSADSGESEKVILTSVPRRWLVDWTRGWQKPDPSGVEMAPCLTRNSVTPSGRFCIRKKQGHPFDEEWPADDRGLTSTCEPDRMRHLNRVLM